MAYAGRGVRPDSIVALNPFEGHRPVRLEGKWRADARSLPAGSYVIPTGQPRGVLAVYLLEPESDDGLVTWKVFDRVLATGAESPVIRVTGLSPPRSGRGGVAARRCAGAVRYRDCRARIYSRTRFAPATRTENHATSTFLPVEPQQIFKFVRNNRMAKRFANRSSR